MHSALERIHAEFLEMPGMRLTVEQVQRLCGVEQEMCQAVLDAMVDSKFLWRKADGTYARLTDGESRRPRPVAADVVTPDSLRVAS